MYIEVYTEEIEDFSIVTVDEESYIIDFYFDAREESLVDDYLTTVWLTDEKNLTATYFITIRVQRPID